MTQTTDVIAEVEAMTQRALLHLKSQCLGENGKLDADKLDAAQQRVFDLSTSAAEIEAAKALIESGPTELADVFAAEAATCVRSRWADRLPIMV